jgi:hypothetical protein
VLRKIEYMNLRSVNQKTAGSGTSRWHRYCSSIEASTLGSKIQYALNFAVARS